MNYSRLIKMQRATFRIFVFLIIILLSGCNTIGYHGPQSDHFDGQRFHFPGEPSKPQSFSYNLYILWKAISQFPWPKMLDNPSPSPQPKRFPNVRLINHASVLIETGEETILTDPIYSYRPSPFPLIGPARKRPPGLSFNQLPKIDIVLISHNHYDHLDIPTIKRLERKFHPLFIVPLGNKNLLIANHIHKIVEMDWWQSFNTNHTKITMLPAQHSSQRNVLDSNRSLWASYGLAFSNHKIYFAGDSAYNHHFKEIHKRWGQPDISILPIGSYEPRDILQKEHIDPDEAMRVHLDLHSKRSIGVHWLTFQLSNIYPEEVLKAFEKARAKYHIKDKDFVALQNGQVIQ